MVNAEVTESREHLLLLSNKLCTQDPDDNYELLQISSIIAAVGKIFYLKIHLSYQPGPQSEAAAETRLRLLLMKLCGSPDVLKLNSVEGTHLYAGYEQ